MANGKFDVKLSGSREQPCNDDITPLVTGTSHLDCFSVFETFCKRSSMCTTLLSQHRETKVWDGKEEASDLLGGRQQSSSAQELWTPALVSTLQ